MLNLLQKNKKTVKKFNKFLMFATISICILGIISIVILLCANCTWMTSNLASILGGVLSAVATVLLGIVAIWQNIEYKHQSDIAEKRLFKVQVFNSCPYFSVKNCDVQTNNDSEFGYCIELKNIGKTFAPFVMVSEIEFSKFNYFIGKSSNNVFNKYFDEHHINILQNKVFEFISKKITYKLIEGETYYSHIILSVVSENQIQFDQQISLQFKYLNNELKFIKEVSSQFLEIYDT